MPSPNLSRAAEPVASTVPSQPTERTVRFVRRFRAYNSGDVAGFRGPLADELIRLGVAVDAAASARPAFVRK